MEALDKLEIIPGVSILVRILPITKVGIMYDTRRSGLITRLRGTGALIYEIYRYRALVFEARGLGERK